MSTPPRFDAEDALEASRFNFRRQCAEIKREHGAVLNDFVDGARWQFNRQVSTTQNLTKDLAAKCAELDEYKAQCAVSAEAITKLAQALAAAEKDRDQWFLNCGEAVLQRDAALSELENCSGCQRQESLVDALEAQVRVLEAECDRLTAALENERMRLAGCGVAALGNTPSSASERITPDNPYYSASYRDVCRAVDQEMRYRLALERIADCQDAHPLSMPGKPSQEAEIAREALNYDATTLTKGQP